MRRCRTFKSWSVRGPECASAIKLAVAYGICDMGCVKSFLIAGADFQDCCSRVDRIYILVSIPHDGDFLLLGYSISIMYD